jgi:DNA primase
MTVDSRDRSARARGSDDWVERVRAASDIVEIVGQTVQLKRVGRNWMGLCPFHDEKTPSFSVNAERQFYHCFSCKAGGDVFKFVESSEHLGFIEAVELLSRRAGITIPERRGAPRGERARLLDAIEASAAAFEMWLADPGRGAKVRAYLADRGLSPETVRAFRLGLAPEGWENLVGRLKGRFPEAVLEAAGLIGRRDAGRGFYDRFRNRLMIPLVAPGGAVVGFGARALADEDQPKYLNSPETPVYHKGSFLFGLDTARRADLKPGEINVVEGYFDAIALHQAGLDNTVATSGTALTQDQARMLRRLVSRAVMAYDGDAAGQGAMLRSLGVLLGEGLDVIVVDLPRGDDPDSIVRREGADGWRRMRDAALDPVAFVQKHVIESGSASGGDPRERALAAVVQLARGVSDPIRARLLSERAAEVFGVSESVVQRAIALARSGQDVARPIGAAVGEQRRGERDAERRLLQALLLAPAEVPAAKRQVSPEDFRDPACASLAGWLWRGDGDPPGDDAATMQRELVNGAPELPDWADEARAALRVLVERRLRTRLKDTKEQLRRADSQAEAARLMQEIQDIGLSLRSLHG